MSESCEYRAVKSNFGKLVDGVTPSIEMFANMAVSKDLIPLTLVSKGATNVMSAVLHRLRSDRNPQKPFQDLVKILRSDASTEHLAQSLMISLEESGENDEASVRDAPQIVFSEERRPSVQKRFVSPIPHTSQLDSGFFSYSEPSQTEGKENPDPMLRYLATPTQASQSTAKQPTKKQPITTEKYLKTENQPTAETLAPLHRTFLYASEMAQISTSTPKNPTSPHSYIAMLNDQCQISVSPCSSIGSPCPSFTGSDFDSLESSISSSSSIGTSATVVGGECYPRSPVTLEEGFVGEEKSSASVVPFSENHHQKQIAELIVQLQRVQQKREEEKLIAYNIFKKNFVLKIQIRCMRKERKKLEKKLQESRATANKLEKASKVQNAELGTLQRKAKLMEGFLNEVTSTCSSLEEQLSNAQMELGICKENKQKWRKQLAELERKLKMAVEDACYHRRENETLRNRIGTLEKLIDRFRELEVQSNVEVRKSIHKSCSF